MSFNVGENVGPYRIIEQLGQGGMATVFKAYHASLDRFVAIKALHPAFNRDVTFESRFQREARVVAKLEHSNIVPVYDYAEHEGRPYLVMKFIEGITLKARMDQGRLSSDEVTKIVDAVGSALAYAHKQGVLHRDIKPSNVLMATDGQIYLADFGLARMAQSGESTLSSDMIMGTPQYISPEQAMGKPDLDQRTDLYSFGVMLYEMVVGKVPFNADTPFSIIHDHIYAPLPLPRVVNPDVPEAVERVLLKALAKEREDRFEDSAHLVKAFKDSWSEAGVPIQGSDINASQVMRSGAGTVAQSVPTKVANVPPTVVRAEEKPKEAEAVQGSSKKRSPWMWVSMGLAVILCVGLFAIVRNNRLFTRFLANRQSVNVTAPLPVPQVNPPVEQPQQDLPSNVADAEKFANEHPQDLDAQLNLVAAYWDAGLKKQTADTLTKISQMAGPENKEFYERAGNDLKSRGAWLPAASMYYQAVKTFEGKSIPPALLNEFREALYKGADLPDAPLMILFEDVLRVDGLMARVALARNNFYNGKIDEAHKHLDEALQIKQNMYEAQLLQAEFDSEELKFDRSRETAKALSSDPAVPVWIRDYAEEILKRLPK